MRFFIKGKRNQKLQVAQCGQSSVEAAYAIPILLILFLVLLQPSILLYNCVVMGNAAAEGCRVLATTQEVDKSACEAFVLRRLGSIPDQENFHVHKAVCSWEIELVGSEISSEVSVEITQKVKLLPLLDGVVRAFGAADENGYIEQSIEVTMPSKSPWVSYEGSSPSDWVLSRE